MKPIHRLVINLVATLALVNAVGLLQTHDFAGQVIPSYYPVETTPPVPAAANSDTTAATPSPPRLAPPPAPQTPTLNQAATPPAASHPNYKYTALISNATPLYAAEPFANRIGAPAALSAINNSTAAPIIAVIDTGFALNHQALAGRWATDSTEMGPTTTGSAQNCASQGLSLDKRCNNVDNNADGYPSNWRGWDFVHGDNNPMAGKTDPNGGPVFHGTMTASLAALLNPNAKIMPLQALDDDGVGYTDTVAAAITYAADHGANIISLSLGSASDDPYLRSQIDYAITKGVVVVAAAGNSGCDCLSYPAAYPEVLSVGASDSTDHVAAFSSYGANLNVLAPGTAGDTCGAIWTAANQTSAYSCGYSGTSFATPLVASVASLILAQDPTASPSDIMRFINQSADKVAAMGSLPRTPQYGYGRVDAYKAVMLASLAAPQGQLINKTSASLSSVDLTGGPLLDSACQGAPGASCSIQVISADGQIVKYLGTQQLDQYGAANFIWNAAAIGLTPGQWRVQATISAQGQTAASQVAYLTITN